MTKATSVIIIFIIFIIMIAANTKTTNFLYNNNHFDRKHNLGDEWMDRRGSVAIVVYYNEKGKQTLGFLRTILEYYFSACILHDDYWITV